MASADSFAHICEQVCEERGWELLPSGVNVSLPGDRHQVVSIELFEHGGEPMVRFLTTIGSAHGLARARAVQALQLNTSLPFGALGIRDDLLCMTHCLILADVDAREFEATLEFLADTADSYEKILFDADEY